MIRKLGDIVYYTGEYVNCHKCKYRIVKIYKNSFNVDWQYDLRAYGPISKTQYKELLSVEKSGIQKLDYEEK